MVFCAPNKLLRLCILSYPTRMRNPACPIRRKNAYVPCTRGVVYEIPLSCGRHYVGQAGRCINVHLLEHNNEIRNTAIDGQLAAHFKKCDAKPQCLPLFNQAVVLYSHCKKTNRRGVGDSYRAGNECLSMPSVLLSKKELHCLAHDRLPCFVSSCSFR